jgi:hypothetical protein
VSERLQGSDEIELRKSVQRTIPRADFPMAPNQARRLAYSLAASFVGDKDGGKGRSRGRLNSKQ